MDQESSHTQNMISVLRIILLVVQSVLLIFVLLNLRTISQKINSISMISQADQVESLVGTQAIDFVLTDVMKDQISLSDYRGQPMLLAFTSHTCSACQEMYPGLLEFTKGNADIEIFIISMNSINENIQFQEEFGFSGYSNLHVLSATSEVFEQYSIIGTPSFIVVNKEGKIVKTGNARTADQIVELTEGISQ